MADSRENLQVEKANTAKLQKQMREDHVQRYETVVEDFAESRITVENAV